MERTTLERLLAAFILVAGLVLIGPYFGITLGNNSPALPEIATPHPRPTIEQIDPLSEIDDLLK